MKKEAIQGNSKRPYTRKLIYEVCRVQTDFRRFLCDEFPYLKRQISSVLTYDDQIFEFLDRETCDEILKKLRDHIENLKEEGELKEERYIELLDETERASQLSEPELNKNIFKEKISRK